MKDINSVLRNKRVQLAELTLEIDGLQAAATALRPVVHLLSEDDPVPGNSGGQIALAEETPTATGEEARQRAGTLACAALGLRGWV